MSKNNCMKDNLDQFDKSITNIITSEECLASLESMSLATTIPDNEPFQSVYKEVHKLRLLDTFIDYTTILPYLDIDE